MSLLTESSWLSWHIIDRILGSRTLYIDLAGCHGILPAINIQFVKFRMLFSVFAALALTSTPWPKPQSMTAGASVLMIPSQKNDFEISVKGDFTFRATM